MYKLLSDDKHQFVQKVHSACANCHLECRCNSNPVATLPHAAVVFCIIGRSSGVLPVHAPQQDPILSFLHSFLPKSTHCQRSVPPQWLCAPPPPNGKSWIRHCVCNHLIGLRYAILFFIVCGKEILVIGGSRSCHRPHPRVSPTKENPGSAPWSFFFFFFVEGK